MQNTLDNNELALLWLHSFSLGTKKREAVLSLFGEPAELIQNFDSKKELIRGIVGDKVYQKMQKQASFSAALNLQKECEKYKLKIITLASSGYPNSLRSIPDRPLVLFALGDTKLLGLPSIAVVGTRRPTSYGKEVVKSFSATLAKNNVVIVSGLAYGIDGIAHTTAIEEEGKTIAVLGGGLDKIYPEIHTTLAKQIVKTGGLLLSEYFPKTSPTQYTFPERNRIISGISNGVLVVEAGENSGSLHTVSHALDQGKELFIVPANINSVASKGSNRILVEMPDALVTEPEQILVRLGIEPKSEENKDILNLSEDEKKIYEIVSFEPIEFDKLAQKTKLSVSTLGSLLTIMEMNGIIRRLPNNIIEAVV